MQRRCVGVSPSHVVVNPSHPNFHFSQSSRGISLIRSVSCSLLKGRTRGGVCGVRSSIFPLEVLPEFSRDYFEFSVLFSEFSGDFWEFIGGISIFVWVEASVRLVTGMSAAAGAVPEHVALNLRWGGASRSIGGR